MSRDPMPHPLPVEQMRALPVDVPEQLARIRVILVEPSHPGNIGAVARAMKGMGLSRLVLVAPSEWRSQGDAWRMAKNSREILQNCREVDTLEAGLEGVQFLVGTTHRRRSEKLPEPIPMRKAAREIAEMARQVEVGILFGPENFGLSTDALSRCHRIASVPMAVRNPSLNLAQAVMIAAYEIFVASLETEPKADADRPLDLVEVNEMERFYERVFQLLTRVEFVPYNQDWSTLEYAVRRVFNRLRLEKRDLATLYQIFAEIDRYLKRKLPDEDAP